MTTTKLITADELYDMEDDGNRYELVRGELVKMTPPGGGHGRLLLDFGSQLRAFVLASDIGELFGDSGFRLSQDPDIVRAPDIAFLRWERVPPEETIDRFLPGPPDLAIEIVSPSDRASDIAEKVEDYLDAGTRLVWVMHPRRRTVTVYYPDRTARILRESDVLDGEDVLPGFRIAVVDIFRRPNTPRRPAGGAS
jgi:Uma2 family endonuclease